MHPAHIVPAAFFRYCQHTWIAKSIQQSTWGFAVIETIHIIALTVLMGTMMIVDLRILGVALRQQPVSKVAAEVVPSFWTAFAVSLITGIALYLSEAQRLGNSSPFFWKIVLVVAALVFHMTVYPRALNPSARHSAMFLKSVACVSLMLWLGVAVAGRAIAFLTN